MQLYKFVTQFIQSQYLITDWFSSFLISGTKFVQFRVI